MLITHAKIITFNPEMEFLGDGAILVAEGICKDVGPRETLCARYRDVPRFDVEGQVVLPGMVLPHTHIYSAFARGMKPPETPPKNFLQVLERVWWRLDKALTPEDIRYSAYATLLDAIRAGTTTVFDHHASPNTVAGSLDVLAEVFQELGLRGCLCYEVSDRDGEEIAQHGIEENVRFARKLQGTEQDHLRALFGLHASFTVSDATLKACAEAGEELNNGFHLHLAEGTTDRRETQRRYGYPSPVRRLAEWGLLNEKTVLAHGVDLTDEELNILQEQGSILVHNPRSNMNNGVGAADVARLLEAGILAGLGTDGMSTSLFTEMPAAVLLARFASHDPSAGWELPQRLVAEGHPQIAQRIFGLPLGRIEIGGPADLIFFGYDSPTPMTAENYWAHILFGLSETRVRSTMVAGRFLMKDWEIRVCDETKIRAEARAQAQRFWQRLA